MTTSIIRNKRALATTALRRDALFVLEAGLHAVRTPQIVRQRIHRTGQLLTIDKRSWDLSRYDHIYVVAIGKAAYDAASTLETVLGARITDGIVLDVKSGPLKRLKSIAGSHPFPSVSNMRATGEIMALLKHVDSRDLLITIVSGGGSSLLCWPYQLKCDDLTVMTQLLMHKGASIHEVNTVRKHLSEIQGGQFARLAYPAEVIGLIFSDVPGDDLGVVASGPTVLDITTVDDARAVLARYNVLKECRLPHCELRETPKDPTFFRHVTNILMVSNKTALEAMETAARKRGYVARVHSWTLDGEARELGRVFAGLPEPGEMVLAAGETIVRVLGKGEGGRNQEFALGALTHLEDDALVLSCASDGIDNTPAAGAIADVHVGDVARRRKLDPVAFLNRNDSYPFFQKTNGHIMTGLTGINISDLMLAARAKAR